MPPRQRRRRIIRPSAIAAVAAGAALLLTHHIHLSDARKITIVRTNNHEQDTGAAGGATVDVVDTGTAGGDMIDDSIFDPVEPDPSCSQDSVTEGNGDDSCVDGGNEPPVSTIEVEKILIDSRFLDAYGGEDPSKIDPDYDDACADELTAEAGSTKIAHEGDAIDSGEKKGQCAEPKYVYRDKHWGSDTKILKMRDRLRRSGAKRPPVFLMPGLAATRLVSWKHTNCKQISNLLSDIKMQDYVWLNINMLIQMATIDPDCWIGCLSLGLNQSDPILKARRGNKDGKNNANKTNGDMRCKLRPDEGLDAISSLAPGSVTSEFLVGGTNTVYAWLTQWLADNLGYDVTSLLGLPYDWRLSPDKMEERDGFLTSTRYRIEAAVKSNGGIPGIMVAHSMGNVVFRYFLEWLRLEMRKETLAELVEGWERRKKSQTHAKQQKQQQDALGSGTGASNEGHRPGWVGGTSSTSSSPTSTQHFSQDRITAFASGLKSGIDTFVKTYFDEEDVESNDQKGSNENMESETDDASSADSDTEEIQRAQLVELSKIEGDTKWLQWLHKHIWTYVGLSAPLIGAVNPLRAVLSGENMGLPMSDEDARKLELSFGSTNNVVPISTKAGFCDAPDGLAGADRTKLACLEELIPEIEEAAKKQRGNKRGTKHDPWKDFPALKHLLIDRVDWDSNFPMIQAAVEKCTPGEKEKKSKEENIRHQCHNRSAVNFSARDAPGGHIFEQFNKIWNEKDKPLQIKRDQLLKSYWYGPVGNILNTTWDRPHIKHVVMSYGVDVPTEVGYQYFKSETIGETKQDVYDGTPSVRTVIWEESEGRIVEEVIDDEAPKSLTDAITQKIGLGKKKSTRREINATKPLGHSGDGTIPYLSLSWAHTWLLHATRAMRHSRNVGSDRNGAQRDGTRISDKHALDNIVISHRPKGENEWVVGAAPEKSHETRTKNDDDLGDTGTAHPHGTKYKPSMIRYQSKGQSRTTGNDYTTAVIEAIGVEHKETTRNYDILAAVFSDVLKNLHDDYPELV